MISVIIPTIGRESLVQSITSVRAFFHCYPEVQIIVVDNGVSSLSSDYLNFLYEKCCEVTRLENSSGVAEARNRGIDQSRFEWLYFLDDDDLMLTDSKLDENFFAFTSSGADIAVFSAKENGKEKPNWNNVNFEGFESIAAINTLPIGSFFVNKRRITSLFDPSLKSHEDFEFLLGFLFGRNLNIYVGDTAIVDISTTSHESRSTNSFKDWGGDLELIYNRYPCTSIKCQNQRDSVLKHLGRGSGLNLKGSNDKFSWQSFVINLDIRPDKISRFFNDWPKGLSLIPTPLRVAGELDSTYPALGCLRSHIQALSRGLADGADFIVIFEDDFIFEKNSEDLNLLFDQVEFCSSEWDVFMLNVTNPVFSDRFKVGSTEFARVLRGTSGSGYVVKREMAKVLVETFSRAIPIMESVAKQPALLELLSHEKNKFFVSSVLALDTLWFPEMLAFRFFTFSKSICTNVPGYSDIERKYVDYSVDQRRL